MINPFAPDASKYADSNIWTAQGSARQVQPQPPVGPPPQLGTGYGLDQPQSLTPSPIGTKPAMRPGMSFGFSMSPRRTYAM